MRMGICFQVCTKYYNVTNDNVFENKFERKDFQDFFVSDEGCTDLPIFALGASCNIKGREAALVASYVSMNGVSHTESFA